MKMTYLIVFKIEKKLKLILIIIQLILDTKLVEDQDISDHFNINFGAPNPISFTNILIVTCSFSSL